MTPLQCRVARTLLKWKQEDLAARLRGKVSQRSIEYFESERHEARKTTVEAVRAALEAAGVVFDLDGINARLQAKPKKARGKTALAVLAFLAGMTIPANARDYRAIDGDTFQAVATGHRVRLYDV